MALEASHGEVRQVRLVGGAPLGRPVVRGRLRRPAQGRALLRQPWRPGPLLLAGYLRVSDGDDDVREEEAGREDADDARADHHVHVHLGRVVVHGVVEGAPVVDEERPRGHEQHAANEGEQQAGGLGQRLARHLADDEHAVDEDVAGVGDVRQGRVVDVVLQPGVDGVDDEPQHDDGEAQLGHPQDERQLGEEGGARAADAALGGPLRLRLRLLLLRHVWSCSQGEGGRVIEGRRLAALVTPHLHCSWWSRRVWRSRFGRFVSWRLPAWNHKQAV